jgi:hypothetical protein
MNNYVVGGTTPMDEIPDHAIQSPFGTTSPQMKTQHERFEKYKEYVIPMFKKLYNLRLGCKSGFDCPVCGSWIGGNRACRLLAHISSRKHLLAAGVLEESDQRNRRGIGRKHTINSTTAPVDTVVADISSGLGEKSE